MITTRSQKGVSTTSTKHQTSHDRDKLARWLRRVNRSQNSPVDGANWLLPVGAKEQMKHRPYEADFGPYGVTEKTEVRKMKAIRKKPGGAFEDIEVANDLKALQTEVDGYIETYTIAEDMVVICNEEGLIWDMEYNTTIAGVSFYGTILLVGVDGENFADVPTTAAKMNEIMNG